MICTGVFAFMQSLPVLPLLLVPLLYHQPKTVGGLHLYLAYIYLQRKTS